MDCVAIIVHSGHSLGHCGVNYTTKRLKIEARFTFIF